MTAGSEVKKDWEKILDQLDDNLAPLLLRVLGQKDAVFAAAIMEEAKKLQKQFPIENPADSVYEALNGIEIEDCWDRSGRKRDGYHDIVDVATEMLEEAFSSFTYQIARLHQTGRCEEERTYLTGVLEGLYQFYTSATSEFSEYVPDDSESLADDVVRLWHSNHPEDSRGRAALSEFIQGSCPNWSGLADVFLRKP